MTKEDTAYILRIVAKVMKTSNLYYHSGPAVDEALEDMAASVLSGTDPFAAPSKKKPAPASML